MRRTRRLVLLGLLGAVAAVRAADPGFAPGETTTLPWDDLANPMEVYVPENYVAGKAWPIVFHYHGTRGDPTVGIPRAYTHGKDFVIVGMEYVTRGKPPPKTDYLDIEIAHLRKVRDFLASKLRIDKKRSYVGGFSKGGWFGSEYAETSMNSDFAGAYILGAGKRTPDRRKTRSISGKRPVYIGVGQMDENYIYGVKAIEHFKKLGAQVTYDEYLGIGHRMPRERSEAFEQWFAIEAARPRLDGLRKTAGEWAKAKLAHAETLGDPAERYLFLEKVTRAPFFALLRKEGRAVIESAAAAARKAPEMKAEMLARSRYLPLLQRELRGGGMEFLRDLVDDYHEVYSANADTYYGKRAGMEVARLRVVLASFDRWHWPSAEARRKVEAEFAADPPPEVPVEELKEAFQKMQAMLGDG